MASLLGPPELCDFSATETGTEEKRDNDFMNMLRRGMAMGRTENFSPTYLSSGDACLDFFFHVVPDTPSERVTQLLEAAWKQNPLTALKLVCQLRGVRGTGKSDREGFYAAACWMHSNHPKTLLANLSVFAEFGYLKDLPEILFRILQGLQQTDRRRAQRAKDKSDYFARKGAAAREAKKRGTLKPREERIAADLLEGKQKSQAARVSRRQKLMEDASRALKRYSNDAQ
ncbi:hypothetical protein SUGI_1031870 [Cryptomeria japonica]|nr:hypothetical protein SUGI_1031870 [Cryptomeria japonica]